MSLHVFLDIRFLGKGTATRNALEGLLTGVAMGNKACQHPHVELGRDLSTGAHNPQEGPDRACGCWWPSW